MAFVEITYEGLDKPLVIDDVGYGDVIGIRRNGNPTTDSWYSLAFATKVRLVLAKDETLAAPGMAYADSATLVRGVAT